jgi:Mg-chelatase subunit ChlD
MTSRAPLVTSVLVTVLACSPGPGALNASNGSGGASNGSGGASSGSGGTVAAAGSDAAGGVLVIGSGGAGQGGLGMLPGTMDACASAAFAGKLIPSSILFVVDRSGSMNCNLPPLTDSRSCEANPVAADTSQPTKWGVLTSSLSSAIDQLVSVPSASAGLTFFSSNDTCGVQSRPNVGLAPLSTPQADALKGALQGVTPRGGTPIIGAVILGYKHLQQQAQAPGNRYVVLVTDGSDSCIDRYASEGVSGDVVDRLLNIEEPKAMSVNIRTFVIGAPGSELGRGFLSKIAFAGGTARDAACDHTSDDPAPGTECHLDMTRTTDFGKDLSAALHAITGQAALSCELAVPQSDGANPVDPTKVNVDYYKGGNTADPASKVELFRDDTKPCDAGASGWQYIEGNTKIKVCGAPCDQIHADPTAQVVVSFGCKSRKIE